MGINISNIVESLEANNSSKVQVGNNTTYIYNRESDQDEKKKLLQALRSTDPRHDKTNIEQTNNDLLKEAYIWILENPEFLAWRQGTDECRLLWIRGDPGKGKTMLLCGIIDELRPSTRLGNEDSPTSLSFFFCQATNSELNSSTAVLRGLIYLLVDQQPHLLSHLRANVHWDSRVAMEDLFRKIVADPTLGETYMIVDALDECLEDLEFLLRIICDTVSRIKWIVSSRNRREVAEGLAESSSKLALSLELNEESVTQAVKIFIDHRTQDLAGKKQLKPEVTQEVHQYLTKHANGTFLWVGLVCRRLARCKAWEIRKKLHDLPEGLDELYARSMKQIRGSDSYHSYIRLLALVSTVFHPLKLSELKAMAQLNMDEKQLPDFIGECGSFLTTRGTTVLFVHQSAKDFLEKESRQLLFQSGLAQHHYALFQRSLDVLIVLKKDMYDLEYPGVSLDAAILHCPKPDPLDSLSYALVFWANHLGEAYRLYTGDDAESEMPFAETVYNFFCKKFLFWLEALSLSHNISVAGKSLLSLKNLLAVCLSPKLLEQSNQLPKEGNVGLKMPFAKTLSKGFSKKLLSQWDRFSLSNNTPVVEKFLPSLDGSPAHEISEPGLPEFIEDALRFLLLFGPVIETHPLQIYTSGLLFSPHNSIIRNSFKESTPSFIKRVPKVDDNWSPILGVFDTSPGIDISTMIFSAKSDMVVMTTSDSQLLMWNVNDGYVHRDSRYNHATLLTPSPDLQLLASITTHYPTDAGERRQDTLEVCELNSRNVLWTVKLNSPHVLAMEFASDSQWLAVWLTTNVYLYGREGKLCQSWTFEPEYPAYDFVGKREVSYHLSYSSNCDLLLCYTRNSTIGIVVFDLRTGMRYEVPGDSTSYADYIERIFDAKFVPNARSVLIAAGGGTYLWDLSKMKYKKWPRPTHSAYRLAYSHGEILMVLKFDDEIFLEHHDIETLLQRFHLPNDTDHCEGVQVSYDNKKIAVYSKSTAWLLDVQTGQADRLIKRYHYILDDWVTIASTDHVTRIEIENPIADVITTLDINACLTNMASSPEGRLFAYRDRPKPQSQWNSIYIWDLKRNSLRFTVEVSGIVEHVAISPSVDNEDQWLAVCTPTKLFLWDVNTTQFHRYIESPSELSHNYYDQFLFSGTWIGFRMVTYDFRNFFVRYDIKSGQQFSRMAFPADVSPNASSMSPNGKWMLTRFRQQLLLSEIEAGIHCAVIDINTEYPLLIDDSAVWTERGVFYLKRILDDLVNKSETGEGQVLEIDGQVDQVLPVITPRIHGHGYSTDLDWITFYGMPLIWLPHKYRFRDDRPSSSTPMSVGHHHIMSRYPGGIYCIVFKKDALDVLRRAIIHVSI